MNGLTRIFFFYLISFIKLNPLFSANIDSKILNIVIENNLNQFRKYTKKKKTNLNNTDDRGKTLLHWAAIKGNTEIFYQLIKFGANPNIRDKKHNTPFHYIVEYGHLNMLKFLFEKINLDIESRGYKGQTMLNIASNAGFLKIVKFLKSKNANLNTSDDFGFTPLIKASLRSNLKIARFLLNNNANIHSKNVDGRNALHCAVMRDNAEIVRLLLKKGSRINDLDNQFKSPLHLAVFKNHIRSIKILLKNKANINIKDNMGMTAFHYCASDDNKISICKLFLKYPSLNRKSKDNWGRTALNLAIEKNKKKMIKLLKENLKSK